GARCLDVGSSTGGFTDCLLQHGAAHVVCVDVGRNQLHERLRADARVTVMEGVNARRLEPDMLPYRPELVTADVSFISLRLVLPPVLACADSPWRALVLVKPQFEVGKGETRRGVVRDPEVRRRVLQEFSGFVTGLGVNFGRVGFLTSIEADDLEDGLQRVFAGEFDVVELPTITATTAGERVSGVNDVVLASAIQGRMAVIEWSVDGQSLGELGCD